MIHQKAFYDQLKDYLIKLKFKPLSSVTHLVLHYPVLWRLILSSKPKLEEFDVMNSQFASNRLGNEEFL